MTGTPQFHSQQIDTDDFVYVILEQDGIPANETIRYDNFVKWLFKPGTEAIMALHCAIGIAGEVGELIEAQTLEHKLEELGDLEFYFQAIRNHYSLSLSYIQSTELDPKYLQYSLNDLLTIATGNICDCVKREYVYGKARDMEAVADALALLAFALKEYTDLHKLTRTHALQANADKLAKRYVSLRYSDAAAIDRADKKAGPQET